MYAKKSLGQHFLRSEKALATIVNAGEVTNKDIVLEIGPGQGDLTARLIPLSAKVIAVEKDDYLYNILKEKFSSEIENGKLDLINGDILDFNPSKASAYKIIANIPYNITGAIIKKFLSAELQPERMVLLVQKEVAERIVAKDGKESILSLSVQAYGKPRIVETVKAGSFAPPPKVDSAIISIEQISKDFFKEFSETAFFDMLHAGFGSKRKKLSGNLSKLFKKEDIEKTFSTLGIDDNSRAETIHAQTWKELGERLLKN